MGGISSLFILLIVLLLVADIYYTTWSDFWSAFSKPEIKSALKLTLLSEYSRCIIERMGGYATGLHMLAEYRFAGQHGD